ncbi:MAG: hypothetical protein CVV18_04400 [Gammaproteobacteria bacterium HGW-Gammaproteobacteria-8]|nr:MAG: hypothetical protein CVV18_04400 [Gammaproteobacteria bacterium HGW-Gammaproteobacteria-8]
MWRWLLMLVILGSLLLGIMTGLLNPQPLILDLFVIQLEAPLGMLVIAVFAGGVIAGALLAGLIGRTRRSRRTAASPASTDMQTARSLSPRHD